MSAMAGAAAVGAAPMGWAGEAGALAAPWGPHADAERVASTGQTSQRRCGRRADVGRAGAISRPPRGFWGMATSWGDAATGGGDARQETGRGAGAYARGGPPLPVARIRRAGANATASPASGGVDWPNPWLSPRTTLSEALRPAIVSSRF